MKKADRKFCKNRGKRIANWLNKSYPFSSYNKTNQNNYSKLIYRWVAEERKTKLIVQVTQERSKQKPFIIKQKNFNLLKEESFDEFKKEVRVLEDLVYKSYARHRKISQILI